MKATKITLTAATATKLATAGVGTNVIIATALTDLYLGDSTVTSDGTTSFKVGTISLPTSLGPIEGELWGISATGGAVYLLTNN